MMLSSPFPNEKLLLSKRLVKVFFRIFQSTSLLSMRTVVLEDL
jgi:hypothetical protein